MQLQLAAGDAAEIAAHTQVKGRIIPLHRVQQVTYLHLKPQLLGNFARHSRLRGFPRFNLATGELPAAAVFMLLAFHSQHPARTIQYNGRHHFHNPDHFSHARNDTIANPRTQTHTDTAGEFSSLQRWGKSVE